LLHILLFHLTTNDNRNLQIHLFQADIQALREKKLFHLIFSKENKAKADIITTFRRQNVSPIFFFSKIVLRIFIIFWMQHVLIYLHLFFYRTLASSKFQDQFQQLLAEKLLTTICGKNLEDWVHSLKWKYFSTCSFSVLFWSSETFFWIVIAASLSLYFFPVNYRTLYISGTSKHSCPILEHFLNPQNLGTFLEHFFPKHWIFRNILKCSNGTFWVVFNQIFRNIFSCSQTFCEQIGTFF